MFRAILRHRRFGGVCLNAGCGEGLYSPLLESLPGVTQIQHIDIADPSRLIAALPTPATGSSEAP